MTPGRGTTGVIILNYGDPTDTLACLDSLEQSDDLDLDIVVVDNGPADAAFDQLAAAVGHRGQVIASGDNLGYAAGNNIGIRHLLERDVDYLWVLNPDTLVEPGTLSRLKAHLAHYTDCGVVGPRISLPGRSPRIWFDGGLVEPDSGNTRHLNAGTSELDCPPTSIDVDYVTGASMLVRPAMIDDVGLLPEHYFLYYEETDWCLRARAKGWRTMVNQRAHMWHHKRSSDELPRPYFLYYMTRNRYHFAADCLRIDPEMSMNELDTSFLAVWREKVAGLAPDWLDSFDELIKRAGDDARAGVTGRNDEIASFPVPRVL